MIVFAKDKLNWVKFEDLPMGCTFVTRTCLSAMVKDHPQLYKPYEVYVRPADILGFAEVKLIQCAIAVLKEESGQLVQPTLEVQSPQFFHT